MSGRLAVPVAMALVGCMSPAPLGARPLPADVAAFVDRRDACDHFRNEEPYDAQRAAELKAKMAETCTGTDKQLARLRHKYARNRHVSALLAHYESRIE